MKCSLKSTKALFFRGFSLVELMVSLTIIMVLVTVLVSQYPETTVRLNLTNLSHTVGFLIREAQVRGSAVDSASSTLGGYGVYASAAENNKFILFGDFVDSSIPKPYGIPIGDGIYQKAPPLNETKTTVMLPAGFITHKLCVGSGFPFVCNNNNNPAIASLTISFTRPNPSPSIYVNDIRTSYAGACIEIRSPRAPSAGHIRNIQVYSSGMFTNGIGKCDNSTQ